MKKSCLSLLLSLIFCMLLLLPVQAADTHDPRLVDDGELLSAEDFSDITYALERVSQKHELDVVIITQDSLGSMSAQSFADDYFDYHNYGYGDGHDGILLLICPNEDVRYISTCGRAIDIFSDGNFNELTSAVLPLLKSGSYATAFRLFVTKCDTIIEEAETFHFPWTMLFIGLAIGAILSFLIPMSYLKGQLKSVRSQPAASCYVRSGSMVLTQNRDVFLYRNVTRTEKPKDDSSSSGGTHTSSSGRSHGGGSF